MTTKSGLENLIKLNRVVASGNSLGFVRFHEDYPVQELNNLWDDTSGENKISYVCQTSTKVIQR